KEKNGQDVFVAQRYFGFRLFLPDFGGYTKENWRDPFDRRKVTVVQVNTVKKDDIGTFTDGSRRPLSPDRFDPRVIYDRIVGRQVPDSVLLYGLTTHRHANGAPSDLLSGTRSNGEFFFFRSGFPPRLPERPAYPPNPLCDVRYYSDKEDLQISYRYSQDHIAKWREIDDA